MSHQAKVFAEGYRGKKLKTENRGGTEHLVPGQHDAIWLDEERDYIELSYVHVMGHKFIVIIVNAEDYTPVKIATVDLYGLKEQDPPADFELTGRMKEAIVRLKTAEAKAA